MRTPPSTHPYVAEISIDPVYLHVVEQRIDDARELRLLDVDDSQPDYWTVRIACASQAVAERIEEAWG